MTLRYSVYGPVPLTACHLTATSVSKRAFWDHLDPQELRGAVGCYIFVQMNTGNHKPWYVGKTERTGFEVECSNELNAARLRTLVGMYGKTEVSFLAK